MWTLNTKNLPLVVEVGVGADLVRLDGGAMCSPGFSCDLGFQAPKVYVVSYVFCCCKSTLYLCSYFCFKSMLYQT